MNDAEQLLARNDVDLVVIVTPNHLHVAQASAALLAGKHVVVDKPLCLQTTQADALIALAASQQRQLAVFQNRRWDSDFLTIDRWSVSNGLAKSWHSMRAGTAIAPTWPIAGASTMRPARGCCSIWGRI